MKSKDWRFPMACPVCQAVNGNPFRVTADGKALKVEVRCGACQYRLDALIAVAVPLWTLWQTQTRSTALPPHHEQLIDSRGFRPDCASQAT